MPKCLSDAQIESYKADGFLSPVTVMSPQEADGFRQKLEDAENRWPDALVGANRNNAHYAFGFLDELVHDSRILDAVEDLIGPEFSASGTVLFIKEPATEGFVSWHQDGTYMGMAPLVGTTVWLALTPSNKETGCMQMIPGSHIGGIQPHHDTFADANILTRGQEVSGIERSEAVDLVLEPGQMSFHHPAVVHGSQPNTGAERRIGFVIQSYIPPEVTLVRGSAYAQNVRGSAKMNGFLEAPRAGGDMLANDVAMRDEANRVWSDILYEGAAQRRNY